MGRYRRRRQVKSQEALITLVVVCGLGLAAVMFSGQWRNISLSLVAAISTPVLFGLLAVLGWQFYHSQAKRKALRLLTLADVDNMSGLNFEKYVAELFRAQGYRIHLTPINDYGVDIVLQRDGQRTAVQTKRYNKPVAQEAVREAVAGKVRYQCQHTMVVTNNSFTKAAIELARINHCQLLGRQELAELAASSGPIQT